jgi:hypothetical protein
MAYKGNHPKVIQEDKIDNIIPLGNMIRLDNEDDTSEAMHVNSRGAYIFLQVKKTGY